MGYKRPWITKLVGYTPMSFGELVIPDLYKYTLAVLAQVECQWQESPATLWLDLIQNLQFNDLKALLFGEDKLGIPRLTYDMPTTELTLITWSKDCPTY